METNGDSKVDCQVSEWSEWSECENCRGYTISTRQITVSLRILQYHKKEKETTSQLQIEFSFRSQLKTEVRAARKSSSAERSATGLNNAVNIFLFFYIHI